MFNHKNYKLPNEVTEVHATIEDIINKYTDIDETMMNTMPLNHEQMFELGCFYNWAEQYADSTDENLDMTQMIKVPMMFDWVINANWVMDNDGEFIGWEV